MFLVQLTTDTFGVYRGTKLLYRGSFAACIAFRRDHNRS